MATAELGLQTGDLPSQLVPETYGAQTPDSLLRSKIESRPLSIKPERLSGWRKGVVVMAGGAAGFAGVMFPTSALASGDRFIMEPGSGDTAKDATEIYCTPEYLASNPQLIAGGDSNVGGETTGANGPKLAEAAGTDTALAIQQPEDGKQRVIINFTDEEGRALQILIPQCPPEGETTVNQTEVEGDELQQRLEAWNSGDFRKDLKIEDLFTTVAKEYYPLNMIDIEYIVNSPEYYNRLVNFQGIYLGKEIIESDDGDRLIVYFGQEGPFRERYYVGVNMGKLTDKVSTNFGKAEKKHPNKTGDKRVSTKTMNKKLNDKDGDIMVFFLNTTKEDLSLSPDYADYPEFKEIFHAQFQQADLSDTYMREITRCYTEMMRISDLPSDNPIFQIINKRITSFDPNLVLYSSGLATQK